MTQLFLDIFRFTSHIRQSMLSSRRIQPIPQDFEHALKQSSIRLNDLLTTMRPIPITEPIQTTLPPNPHEEDSFNELSFLGVELNGEDDRAKSAHIPKHFPKFPSRHTYRATPVYTDREQDPRKIREQATEDGRHGEEALRKLARAASQDPRLGGIGREKRLWGRKMESMDSMFEKTVKGLFKRVNPASKTLDFEIGPVINCDRDLWRRTTASGGGGGGRRVEEKSNDSKDGG